MNLRPGQPLSGLCIVTTRPCGQAAGLARELEALGAEVLNFPVIEIAPADPAPLRALDLAGFDMAFFVSVNAVEQALAMRPRTQWPASVRVATVGPASAAALAQQGFHDVLAPTSGFDSEAVLALPAFSEQAVAGRRVLVLRGDGGRELLAEVLRQRGAIVTQTSCYRRVPATLDPVPLQARHAAGALAALVFSASEGVRFFIALTGDEGRAMLRSLPCFAPHPRICEALREAGVVAPVLTQPGDAGIATSLAASLPARLGKP